MARLSLNAYGWTVVVLCCVALLLYWFAERSSVKHVSGPVISVRRLLSICIHLAENSGTIIKDIHKKKDLHSRLKSNGSYNSEKITSADLMSHRSILSGLHKAIPGIIVRSEEQGVAQLDWSQHDKFPDIHPSISSQLPSDDLFLHLSDLVVWVDPLDATQEFTEDLLDYVTVMLCVAFQGRPLIGVIHQPFRNQTYWHWRGYGASESITRLVSRSLSDTSRGANLQELRITISRSHLNQKVNESLIRAFSPQKIQILAAGGSGFKLLSLLEGKADLYVHPSGSNKWDLCASCALIDAVHGRATGLDGSILDFSAHGPVRIPDTTGFFAAVSDQLYSRWQKVAVASFIPNNP